MEIEYRHERNFLAGAISTFYLPGFALPEELSGVFRIPAGTYFLEKNE